jgi:hypothetical protein
MPFSKLLRPNVGIYIATADAFGNADVTSTSFAPTLAQVTDATKIYNVSPALTDNYTLNLTDSDTNSSLSVVDAANSSMPTAYNYEASFDGFVDANGSTSFYNQFKTLITAAVGTKYYLIKRIGKPHDSAMALGDVVSVFGVTLDYPDDIIADGEPIKVGARFIPTGEAAVNVAVAAGTAGAGFWPTSATATGTKVQANGNIVVYWLPASAVASDSAFVSSPSVATITGASGINLTEAIAWDGYALGATASNAVDDKGIIDKVNAKSRGFANYEGSLTFFRGKFPTSTQTVTGTSAAFTLTLTNAANFVEPGMKVTGTGVGTGAVVTAVSGSTITVSVANSASVSSATFTSTYSVAYDTFKAATNARPTGWLITRVGKSAGTALAAADKISVFKFTADAVMDNTEGEDSVKFMVKFIPQGVLGVNVTAAA